MTSTYATAKFVALFEDIVEELQQIVESYNLPKDALSWFTYNLKYNVPGGKLTRGLSMVDTYCILKATTIESLSDTEYKKVAFMGWAIELLQASILVTDDIMDSSKTRRGHQCWYLRKGVGQMALNDAFLLEAAAYMLLKKHFRQDSYYADVVDLFHEVAFQTELGQLLDMVTADNDQVDLSKYTMEKFSSILILKTAYYSFYLPVALAMYMCGVTSPKDLNQVKNIVIPLGEYYQVQNDYWDCFGTAEQCGKIGTDIKDNKCSWMVIKAMELASSSQRKVLEENYGRKSDESEKIVKDLFLDLQLPEMYRQYEEATAAKLQAKIASVNESRGLKREVLTAFLDKIYKCSRVGRESG